MAKESRLAGRPRAVGRLQLLAVVLAVVAVIAVSWIVLVHRADGIAVKSVLGAAYYPAIAVFLVAVPVLYRFSVASHKASHVAWLTAYLVVVVAFLLLVPAGHARGFWPSGGEALRGSWLLRGIVAFFPVLVLVRMHKYGHRAQRWIARGGRNGSAGGTGLLSSQQRSLRLLVDYCAEGGADGPSASVALLGTWGSGKTRLLSALAEYCSDDTPPARRAALVGQPAPIDNPKLALIMIDVWRDDLTHDPTSVLMDAVAGHPACLRRCRWLVSPSGWRIDHRVREVRLGIKDVKTEVALTPPRLRNLRALESQLRQLTHCGYRVIIAFDEVDRAEPLNGQSALTVAQRGLDVPGVTTLVSCSQAHLSRQLASPLFPALADLESSRMAHLMENNWAAFAARYSEVLRERISATGSQSSPADARTSEAPTRWLNTQQWNDVQVAARYAYLDVADDYAAGAATRLLAKYVGTQQVDATGPQSAVDVRDACRVFPTVARTLESVCSLTQSDLVEGGLFAEKVTAGTHAFGESVLTDNWRDFERAVLANLAIVATKLVHEPAPAEDSRTLAGALAVVLAALSITELS